MKKLLAVFICFLPMQSYAMSGSGFLEICTTNDREYSLVCQGYVGAILEMRISADEAFKKFPEALQKSVPADKRICMPLIEAEQAKLIIIKWLQSHPESLHKRASDEATKALFSAFPCTE